MDKRKLLRASPPQKSGRTIQVALSARQYEELYNFAFDKGFCLADAVRLAIRHTTEDHEAGKGDK